jgi:serine/threonine-protein kinase
MTVADPRLPHGLDLRDALAGQIFRGSAGISYHLRDRIGEGGQGWVFRATWDEPDGFTVIVKVLRPDAVTPETLGRFRREAEVLRMLGQQPRPNPYIVRFFDHAVANIVAANGEKLVLPFTVLEYVHGSTLEGVLAQQQRRGMPLDRARRITRHVVLALEQVHAQKVVHRDLKPSNILLASDGESEIAKVTDFGLVKVFDISLKRTTTLAGASLGYAPPEQFEQGNQRVSPRTDVFSLTVIFFEMLTGRPAFPFNSHENPLLIVTRILNGPRPALARYADALPPELQQRMDLVEKLDAQIARATASDPADRHETISELWASIDPIMRAAFEGHRSITPSTTPALGVGDTLPSVHRATPLPTADPSQVRRGRNTGRTVSRNRDASPARPTEAQSANPASWKWRLRTPPVRGAALRHVALSTRADAALAIGAAGVSRWNGQVWAVIAPPAGVDPRSIHGLLWGDAGDVILYGAQGFAGRITPTGAFETWSVPDRTVTFRGGLLEASGTTTLVGERPARGLAKADASNTIGCVAQFNDGRLSLLSDAAKCARLNAAARLTGGTLAACGDFGALVRLELGVVDHAGSVCAGHLFAIAALPDGGALTVGAGGHALVVSPKLEAQLEAVQTTRDIYSLDVSDGGVAWAGAAQARILRRTGGSWVRMSGDVGTSARVVALYTDPRTVRAICEDGAVIEGAIE